MGISTKLKNKFDSFTSEEKKKLIKMAWNDRTTMQEIKKEFELSPGDLEKFLRTEFTEKDFKRWKIRQNQRFTLKGKKAQKRIAE